MLWWLGGGSDASGKLEKVPTRAWVTEGMKGGAGQAWCLLWVVLCLGCLPWTVPPLPTHILSIFISFAWREVSPVFTFSNLDNILLNLPHLWDQIRSLRLPLNCIPSPRLDDICSIVLSLTLQPQKKKKIVHYSKIVMEWHKTQHQLNCSLTFWITDQ